MESFPNNNSEELQPEELKDAPQPLEVSPEASPMPPIEASAIPMDVVPIESGNHSVVRAEQPRLSVAQQFLVDYSNEHLRHSKETQATLNKEEYGDLAESMAYLDRIPRNVANEVRRLIQNIDRYYANFEGEYALGEIFTTASEGMIEIWLAQCAAHYESLQNDRARNWFLDRVAGLRTLVNKEYFDKYSEHFFADLLPGGFANYIAQQRAQRKNDEEAMSADRESKKPWWKKLFG